MTAAVQGVDWDDPTTPWEPARLEALRRSRGRCVARLGACRSWASSVHHILPRSRSGGNEQDNLMPVCLWCHAEIHDQPKASEKRGFLRRSSRPSKQPLFQRRPK